MFKFIIHTNLTRITPEMIEWLNENIEGHYQIENDFKEIVRRANIRYNGHPIGSTMNINTNRRIQLSDLFLTLCFQYETDATAFVLRWI